MDQVMLLPCRRERCDGGTEDREGKTEHLELTVVTARIEAGNVYDRASAPSRVVSQTHGCLFPVSLGKSIT